MRRGLLAILSAATLAGCTVGSTTGAVPPSPTRPQTSTLPSAPSGTAAPLPTSGATNLRITDTVRAQLLAAGASAEGFPPSDYSGLMPGRTYYAYDAGTNTYWAGAALDPAPNAYQAQVASQDEGSYLIFQRTADGSWSGKETGEAGLPGATCPVQIPDAVLSAWDWPAGSCDPPVSQFPSATPTTG